MITSDSRLPKKYWISDLGRVANSYGHIMKSHKGCNNEYMNIQFSSNGKKIQKYIHRLVLQAFKPQPNDKLLSRHMDDDKSNNRLDNLKWGTHKDNGEDEVRAGKTSSGTRNINNKLTETQVQKIRLEYKKNIVGCSILGKKYNVYPSTIRSIIKRKTWKYI